MGAGSFFQKYLNPIGGGPLGQVLGGKLNPLEGPVAFAGKNSFLAKESSYDPIAKFLNPAAQAAGQAYSQRHNPPPGYVAPATPYAGVAPSLAAAQAGYQRPPAPPPASSSTPTGAFAGDQSAAGGASGPLAQQLLAVQRAQRTANPWATALGAA